MNRLLKLQNSFRDLTARGKELRSIDPENMTDEETTELRDLIKKIERVKDQINDEETLISLYDQETREAPKENTERSNIKITKDNEAERPFRNFGEQLISIYRSSVDRSKPIDKRLLHLNKQDRAASGMNTMIDSEGGFAVQTDFAAAIFDTAVKDSPILSLCDTYTVGGGSNGVHYIDIDETDISETVFGGVQVYWADEAETVAASKPKLRANELRLKKLMGLAYATEEMMSDSNFISQLYSRAFTTAIRRKLSGDVIDGTGVGKPQGILKSGALLSVAKKAAQVANTVVYENIVKMWHRAIPDSRGGLVWLVNPDVEEQFEYMDFPVGTGGVPVFLTAGSLRSDNGVSTLKGRPVIPTDHCSPIGTKGDIILADLNSYMLLRKGEVDQQTSIHVRFVYDEMAFRFTYRANGTTKKNTTLKIKNSAMYRSTFITLDTRA